MLPVARPETRSCRKSAMVRRQNLVTGGSTSLTSCLPSLTWTMKLARSRSPWSSIATHAAMTDFLQLLVSGLATGSIYALAGLGFTLLWQASGTLNFAQGEFVMLPAFGILA